MPRYTLKSLLLEYLEFSTVKSWSFLTVSLKPGSYVSTELLSTDR